MHGYEMLLARLANAAKAGVVEFRHRFSYNTAKEPALVIVYPLQGASIKAPLSLIIMACPSQVIADAQFEQLEYVGDGLFSRVWRVENTDIAIKIPDEPGEASIVEKKIYDRVSPHPFVLQCYGDGESTLGKGLVLRYLPAGTLKTNLDLKKFPLERTQ